MFGPSPAEMEQYRAFLKKIGPEARGRRIRIAGTTCAAAAGVFAVGMWSGHPLPGLSASGLILDIGGAGLLTLGLLLSKEMIGEMGANRLGGNDAPRLYWEATSVDARIALGMLTLGFVAQIFSAVLPPP